MTDAPTAPADTTPQEGDGDQQQEPQTFDADYVAKLRKETAKYRTEAKANADAAAKLAAIEAANKTAEQRAADDVAAAKAEAEGYRNEAIRYRIVAEFSLTDDQAKSLEHIPSEDGMREVAAQYARVREDAGRTHKPKPDPNQGRAATGTASTAELFAAAAEPHFTR